MTKLALLWVTLGGVPLLDMDFDPQLREQRKRNCSYPLICEMGVCHHHLPFPATGATRPSPARPSQAPGTPTAEHICQIPFLPPLGLRLLSLTAYSCLSAIFIHSAFIWHLLA